MADGGKMGGLAGLLGAKPSAVSEAPAVDDTAQTAGVDAAQAFIDATKAGDAAATFEAFRDMLSAADGMAAETDEL
jgi:hypothetical protein